MTPLWFVVDRGVIYLPTGTQSWAGRNAAQHPDVTLMFGGERWMASGRMLRLRGRASCVPRPLPRRALIRIVAKYYLRPRSLLVELRHASRWRVRGRYHDGSGGPGYLTVTPTSAQFLSPP